MQVSTILWQFIGMTTISLVTNLLCFLSGGSKWCREWSYEQSLQKRCVYQIWHCNEQWAIFI